MSRRGWIVLALLAGAPWIGATAAAPVRERPIMFLLLFAIPAAAWLACAFIATGPAPRLPSLRLVLVAGLAMRVLALPAAPSDDVWRYLWEADVFRAGHDPYVSAPGSPDLAELRAVSPPGGPINHPDWTAIYPPVAQAWNIAFAHGVLTFKVSLVLAEIAALLLLLRMLAAAGLPRSRALVYWWCPLPVYAFAMEGHIDAVALALIVAALAGFTAGRGKAGGVALAGALLVKPFALAIAPAWVRTVRPSAWLALVAAASVSIVPFLSAGSGLLRSMLRFGAEMRTGDTLHAVTAAGLAMAGIDAPIASRVAVVAAWLAIAAAVVLRGRPDGIRGSAFLLGALLLLLPTLHPWYLAPMLPLLCFVPWRGWLVLSVTIVLPLAAHVEMQETGAWTEWRALTWLAFLPFYAWLLSCAWRRIGDLLAQRPRRADIRARRTGSGS